MALRDGNLRGLTFRDSAPWQSETYHRARLRLELVAFSTPGDSGLVSDLEATRWTGRPGYPIRAMVGMALVKSLYAIPTWTKTVRLVGEHAALLAALGCERPFGLRLLPLTAHAP